MKELLDYIESIRDKVWLIGKIEFNTGCIIDTWSITIVHHTQEGDVSFVEASSCDRNLCFAEAQVKLKDKMADTFGWF